MSATTVAAIRALVHRYRQLTPLLEEHLEENYGEVLSHLVMSDVVRWLVAHLDQDPDLCRSIVDWLEREFERGPEDVRDLIALSGVEMIPDPGHPGSDLRDLLGPALRSVDPWLI
ncbi:MAG: DUF7674 family protein [Dermatophilaceae bacterium]